MWFLWWICGFLSVVRAEDVLVLSDVLNTLSQHPEWHLASVEPRVAEGELWMRSARFTPNLTGEVSAYDEKYGRQINVHQASLQTPVGLAFQTGWQQGVGDFPAYDGRYTVDNGEVFIGVMIPLLDGLWQNQDRTNWMIQDLQRQVALMNQRQHQLNLITAAAVQYWKWRKMLSLEALYLQNLTLAEKRQTIFEQQHQSGVLSKLSLIDNQREVQERRQMYRDAVQQRQVEALKLSYYLRDVNGDMSDLSNHMAMSLLTESLSSSEEVNSSPFNRPDVQIWDWIESQIQAEQQLAKAKQLPKVNLSIQQMHPMTQSTYGGVENYVGLKYDFSPMIRAERGKLMVLEAKRSSIEMYRRKSIDKATQEIQSIVLHLDGLTEQIAIQNDVVTLAEEALRLESIRYIKGGSDLLDLFKRESNLLKAQQTLVKLKADVQIQMALIWAATGVFPNTITRFE